MGCYKLGDGGCCRLTRGCVPGNSYNIVTFNLRKAHRRTVGFVSDLGLTYVIARITSTHAYMLRPTDRARHRLASRRLVRTNITPSLVHLSINVRGIGSVVTSLRRTVTRIWAFWGQSAGGKKVSIPPFFYVQLQCLSREFLVGLWRFFINRQAQIRNGRQARNITYILCRREGFFFFRSPITRFRLMCITFFLRTCRYVGGVTKAIALLLDRSFNRFRMAFRTIITRYFRVYFTSNGRSNTIQ